MSASASMPVSSAETAKSFPAPARAAGDDRSDRRLTLDTGAYLRFTGELRVQRIVDDGVVEEFADEAIWDLMYFGHAREEA